MGKGEKSHNYFINFEKRGMKSILKKVGNVKFSANGVRLFTQAGKGNHVGIIIDEGKVNSLIIGVTHSKILPKRVKTFGCQFSGLLDNTRTWSELNFKSESRATLSIVDNRTTRYTNKKFLNKLQQSTGLVHKRE